MLRSHIHVDKRIQKVSSPNELQFEVELTRNKDADVRDINNPKEERIEEAVEQLIGQSSI